jgi:hypothetical protein
LLLLLALLAACGSDDKDDDGDGALTTYSLSGTVSGLTGSGLVLQNNGSDDLPLNSDGSFSFATELSDGTTYAVTVATQPIGQACLVANGSGTIASADVNDIAITCSAASYTVGGRVTGLSGNGLVLQNNGADDLSITTDGAFSFAKPLQYGSAYAVTIATQPSGQTCSVNNSSGSVEGADVSDVVISCPLNAVSPSVSVAGPKLLRFSWNDVGADHYRLLKNPDGNAGYSQVGEEITEVAVDEEIPVHLTDWVNASYMVQACNGAGDCTDSVPIGIASLMLDSIGYFKASNIDYNGQFGASVDLSGDGYTLAVAAPGEYSAATNDTSGAVYILIRSGESWSQQANIKRPAEVGSDLYWLSLALSEDGNTLAVCGASTTNHTVHIFIRNGTTWSQEAMIELPDGSGCGWISKLTLSFNGDLLAVGGDSEKAYLFERRDSVWSRQVMLEAPNVEDGDYFGGSLVLSDDGTTLAVSALSDDSATTGINGDQTNNGAVDSGAVYVFVSNGGEWVQQAYIKASNTDSEDRFGNDLSLSADGSTLAVAAMREDSSATGVNGDEADNAANYSGAVYLFERNGASWMQSAYIKASNAEAGDRFGSSIALSADGNHLAVTAPGERSLARGIGGDQTDNSTEYVGSGAAYLFTRDDTTWSQKAYVKATNTEVGWEDWVCTIVCYPNNHEFGSSVALSNDGSTLVVGARGENSGDPANQEDDRAPYSGAVYLY